MTVVENFLAWLTAGVTNPFQGDAQGQEHGVDLGVDYHTPIGSPWSGTVTNITTGGWGQEVDFRLDNPIGGQPQASIVHFDTVQVQVGQHVNPGDLLGQSGGQLGYGVHPAVEPFSSGPHVEVDLWSGTPWQSSSIDPTPYVKSWGQQVLAGQPLSDNTTGSVATPLDSGGLYIPGVSDFFGNLKGLVQWIANPRRMLKMLLGVSLMGAAIYMTVKQEAPSLLGKLPPLTTRKDTFAYPDLSQAVPGGPAQKPQRGVAPTPAPAPKPKPGVLKVVAKEGAEFL